jgi:hypothetical protein
MVGETGEVFVQKRQVTAKSDNNRDVAEVNKTLTQPLADKLAECRNIRQVELTLKNEGCEKIKSVPPGFKDEDHTITFTKNKLNYSQWYMTYITG